MRVSLRASSAMVGVAASMIFLGACDDKFDFSNVILPVATTLTVVPGSDGQIGVAGRPLPVPITVHVRDQNGNSIAAAVVSWTLIGPSGSVSSPTSTTNASGDASVIWTLGTAVGTDSLSASITNGTAVLIRATAIAGQFEDLLLNTGNNQSVPITTTSAPLVVKAVDANGNPVAGVAVAFASTGPVALNAVAAVTDLNGLASTTITAATTPASGFTVTATAGVAAPVVFNGTIP